MRLCGHFAGVETVRTFFRDGCRVNRTRLCRDTSDKVQQLRAYLTCWNIEGRRTIARRAALQKCRKQGNEEQ